MTTATHIITTETDSGFVVRGYGSFDEAKDAAGVIALETRKSVGYDEHGTLKAIGGFATQGHSLLTISDLAADELTLIGLIEVGQTMTVTLWSVGRESDLRAMRKRLGLTQQQLADALGVGRTTIWLRETGRVPVAREAVLAMQWLAEHPGEVRITRETALDRRCTEGRAPS